MSRLSGCALVCLLLGAGVVRCADPPEKLPPRAVGRVGPKRLGKDVSVEAVAFAPDGKLFLVGGGSTPRLFETATLREPVRFTGGRMTGIDDLAFAADGKTFAASGLQGGTTFWNVTGGAPIRELTDFPIRRGDGEGQLADDLQTIVAWNKQEVVVRDTGTNRERRRFHLEPALQPSCVSPNGKMLATRSEGGNPLVLFDVEKGRRTHTLPTDDANVGVTFAPNCRLLGTVDRRNNLHVWEAATGRERCVIRPHEDVWFWFEFSNDGRTVATFCCGDDGPIRLFDALTGQKLGEVVGNGAAVRSLAYSPDDRLLASGGKNGTVLVWDVADWTLAWRKQRPLPERADEIWNDLGSADAAKVRVALAALEAAGDPVCAFLVERARQSRQPAPLPERVAQWLKDLNSEEFEVREKASRELEKHVHVLAPVLKRALAEAPSAEARRRLQVLVDRMVEEPLTPETMRAIRSVEVLERLNTPEARRVLKQWADGAGEDRQTLEAKAALEWLGRRPMP
jgi:hypothetical protein